MRMKPYAKDADSAGAADFNETGELAVDKAAGLCRIRAIRIICIAVFEKEVRIMKYQLDATIREDALTGA